MKLTCLGLWGLLVAACAVSTCPPGNYLNDYDCKPCPKGTFQDESSKPYCIPCQGETFAPEVASKGCKLCQGDFKVPSELKNECVCRKGALLEGNNKCVLCKPGTMFKEVAYSYDAFLSCEPCRPGYFQPEAGKTHCLPCPEGTTSKIQASKCIACAEDEFVNASGRCDSCPPGQGLNRLDGSDDKCTTCGPNRFKASKGAGPCLPCPPRSYSNRGATKCTQCPKGQALMKSGVCGKCPAGTSYDATSKKCRECQKGSFMPHQNTRQKCFRCAGNASSMKGAKKCVSCPQDKLPMRNGTCAKCPVGTAYNPNNFSCKRCRVNTFSDGSLRYDCDGCNSGSYSLPGSGTCFTCPTGEALILKDGKCGKCAAGFSFESFGSKCSKCYRGSYIPEPNIEMSCRSCSSGKSNKNRTACIPK